MIWEFSATSCNCDAVCPAITIPFSTAFTEVSINVADSFAAWALWSASTFTWFATTANPFPASPALAASMEAFNASRFVWAAISLIVAMILSISFDAPLISFMESTISLILPLLSRMAFPSSSTLPLISFAVFEFFSTCSETPSTVAVSSSTTAAWFVAPSARSLELAATCSAALETSSETCWIPFIVSAMLSSNNIKEFRIPTKSPFHSTSGCTSKFPSANIFIARPISST